MALTGLQKRIMRRLALNRSPSSYLAGGLNLDWPRRSDDIDIFHDTDEEVSEVAENDIADLEKEGFSVTVDVRAYGTWEATVSDDSSSTVIQWMSDTRIRFFPLVKDQQWGLRLHQADLAVNKVLAASSRRKARDFAVSPRSPPTCVRSDRSSWPPPENHRRILRRRLSNRYAGTRRPFPMRNILR